ncbi:hypothetical protein WDA79_11710, partial [Streptomyces sp. A475]|uniref:hypothetical protein n=1 Tax=Streptomyces sp. A475 TaxID=3131976 RepID=UPI0030C9F3BC
MPRTALPLLGFACAAALTGLRHGGYLHPAPRAVSKPSTAWNLGAGPTGARDRSGGEEPWPARAQYPARV